MSELRLPSINRVVIAGRLTHDPQLNYTQSGIPLLRMRIASNHSYKDREGEWQQETTFLPVLTWNKLAENCSEYLTKGSAVYVEGRLKSHQWEDLEGKTRQGLEVQADSVQFLDKVGSSEPGEEEGSQAGTRGDEDKGSDDDLPF